MTEQDTSFYDNKSVDPFDPVRLRLTDSSELGVKKAITVISCSKPSKQQFIRVHPAEDYRLSTALLIDEVNHEAYLVAQDHWGELANEIQPTILFAAIKKIMVFCVICYPNFSIGRHVFGYIFDNHFTSRICYYRYM